MLTIDRHHYLAVICTDVNKRGIIKENLFKTVYFCDVWGNGSESVYLFFAFSWNERLLQYTL